MKTRYIIFSLLLTSLFSQVSVSDLKKLSNSQMDMIRSELLSAQAKSGSSVDKIAPKISDIDIISQKSNTGSRFFGYSFFEKNISFFDNVPTPANFKLGPGDEITLSLWGENNSRESFIINKEGLIYYKNIGFISLSNLTIDEAESKLKKELSKIYSTLLDESTQLMIELGQLKSINVFFSGQIKNPGINLIHPFSDIFTAITQAGGVKLEGSLRNVQIIRSGKIAANIDFYSFLTTGQKDFAELRVLEGDVIHIPVVEKRVELKGSIINNGFYEVLEGETIAQIVEYAGGLSQDASSSAILDLIIPLSDRTTDDFARESKNISIDDFNKLTFNDGDKLNFLSIPDVDSKVQIIGQVKNPGFYSAKSTLKEILNLAGGFDDPSFRKTIIDDKISVVRKDETQFYSQEFIVGYDDSENFNLNPEDLIFVYQNSNFDNSFFYTIEGEVLNPGPYVLRKGATIGDAIEKAGGFTIMADQGVVVMSSTTDALPNSISSVESGAISNVSLETKIANKSVIKVLPESYVINVTGNVYKSGLISTTKSVSVSKALELAGGMKRDTLKRDIYITRKNGEINQVKSFLSRNMKRVYPGDSLTVPLNPSPNDFDITSFIADLSTTLANIAAILIIVDNNSN